MPNPSPDPNSVGNPKATRKVDPKSNNGARPSGVAVPTHRADVKEILPFVVDPLIPWLQACLTPIIGGRAVRVLDESHVSIGSDDGGRGAAVRGVLSLVLELATRSVVKPAGDCRGGGEAGHG